VVEIDVDVFGPELSLDIFACDNVARAFEQQDQDSQWLILQLQLHAMLPQLSCPRV
jgi:hypothetical protein